MDYAKIQELIKEISKEVMILVAEDNNFIRKIVVRMLKKWNLKVVEAKDGKEAWEKFKENYENIGVVILDWVMPEMDGLEVCRLIRKTNVGHYVYVIFLSAVEEKEKIAQCLEVGADDYIIKPVHEKEFLARITAGLRIIALEKLLLEANEKLERLATIDELTGILNRRAPFEELKKSMYRALREGKELYIIMLDIDHFKRINDTYGHQVGDKVLQELAKRIKNQLRPYDVIGRYGGEEFLVVLLENNEKTSIGIAERMRLCISEKPFVIENLELNITISLGVTSFKPTKEIDIDMILIDLLKQVDAALYEAKNKGRNCVVYKNFAL